MDCFGTMVANISGIISEFNPFDFYFLIRIDVEFGSNLLRVTDWLGAGAERANAPIYHSYVYILKQARKTLVFYTCVCVTSPNPSKRRGIEQHNGDFRSFVPDGYA